MGPVCNHHVPLSQPCEKCDAQLPPKKKGIPMTNSPTNQIRYKWEFHPNPNAMTIHLTVALPRCMNYDIDELCGIDKAFIERINSIEGVTGFACGICDRYSLTVYRGEMFEWLEIQKEVLLAIMQRYSPKTALVEIRK
jgi:hypothetical protein